MLVWAPVFLDFFCFMVSLEILLTVRLTGEPKPSPIYAVLRILGLSLLASGLVTTVRYGIVGLCVAHYLLIHLLTIILVLVLGVLSMKGNYATPTVLAITTIIVLAIALGGLVIIVGLITWFLAAVKRLSSAWLEGKIERAWSIISKAKLLEVAVILSATVFLLTVEGVILQ